MSQCPHACSIAGAVTRKVKSCTMSSKGQKPSAAVLADVRPEPDLAFAATGAAATTSSSVLIDLPWRNMNDNWHPSVLILEAG